MIQFILSATGRGVLCQSSSSTGLEVLQGCKRDPARRTEKVTCLQLGGPYVSHGVRDLPPHAHRAGAGWGPSLPAHGCPWGYRMHLSLVTFANCRSVQGQEPPCSMTLGEQDKLRLLTSNVSMPTSGETRLGSYSFPLSTSRACPDPAAPGKPMLESDPCLPASIEPKHTPRCCRKSA